ncbi:hypothetical protein Acid7E03_43380 [Acidisoma sp. 7E03]
MKILQRALVIFCKFRWLYRYCQRPQLKKNQTRIRRHRKFHIQRDAANSFFKFTKKRYNTS